MGLIVAGFGTVCNWVIAVVGEGSDGWESDPEALHALSTDMAKNIVRHWTVLSFTEIRDIYFKSPSWICVPKRVWFYVVYFKKGVSFSQMDKPLTASTKRLVADNYHGMKRFRHFDLP